MQSLNKYFNHQIFKCSTYYMELVIDKLMYKAFVETTDKRKMKRE
jgi:hypothetical protein